MALVSSFASIACTYQRNGPSATASDPGGVNVFA